MADSDDPELDVNIRVSQEGAQEAEAAVKKVGEAAEDAGEKSASGLSEAAHGMREFTGSTREGQEVVRGLEAAMRGGASGVGEMIRGLRAMTLVMAHLIEGSGPMGLLLLGLGALAGALLALSKHSKEAGDEMEKTGNRAEELKKKVEEVTKSIEEGFKADVAAVKELEESFAEVNKMAEESTSRTKAMDSEEKKLTLTKIDLEKQQKLSAATTDDERKSIDEYYEAKKKLTELNFESNDSDNAARQAEVQAGRSQDELAGLGRVGLSADARARQAQTAADNATSKATAYGSVLLENAKTGTPISEADEKKRRALSDDAFAAQAGARKAQEEREKVHEEISKAGRKAEDDQTKAQDAKQLNAATQARIQAERDLANATLAATRALDGLAAKAKESGGESKKDVEGPKESKSEALADKAADDHLTIQGEKALEKMAAGTERHKKAIIKHAETVTAAHQETAAAVEQNTKHVERTTRQLVNSTSYNTSP